MMMTAPQIPRKDDLDAFFDAAASKNTRAMRMAAEKVKTTTPAAPGSAQDRADEYPIPPIAEYGSDAEAADYAAAYSPHQDGPDQYLPEFIADNLGNARLGQNLDGKFVAIDPQTLGDYRRHGDSPFVLVPAGVHRFLPWWTWLLIGGGLILVITGMVLLPGFHLNRLTGRLGDSNEAVVQRTMRQIIVNANNRTVNKLYDLAASSETGMTTRLRAVDTMSLIRQSSEVDRALLRLELAGGTDEKVREAAIAARKQRAASRTRALP